MTQSLNFIAPLFVPGNRPERFEKAAASGADAIIIDLEDAVPPDAKEQARSSLRTNFTEIPILVRINAAATKWYNDDLAAVMNIRSAGIIVPKAELGSSLEEICASFVRCGRAVVALIETAHGLADIRRIATLPGVGRLVFGSIDFCADLGCAHTRESLLAARSELVLASRLAEKLPPIDGVTTSIDDMNLVEDDARYARTLGFGGKLCIHPRQVDAVQAGFRPDASEITWARRILASGDGATVLDGAMVDEPVRIRARVILTRSGQIATGDKN